MSEPLRIEQAIAEDLDALADQLTAPPTGGGYAPAPPGYRALLRKAREDFAAALAASVPAERALAAAQARQAQEPGPEADAAAIAALANLDAVNARQRIAGRQIASYTLAARAEPKGADELADDRAAVSIHEAAGRALHIRTRHLIGDTLDALDAQCADARAWQREASTLAGRTGLPVTTSCWPLSTWTRDYDATVGALARIESNLGPDPDQRYGR